MPREGHDREKWGETPDTTPVEIPGNRERPLSLREDMRRFIREELSKHAAEQHEAETFEESDDFTIDEDEIPITSQYTVRELTPEAAALQVPDDLDGDPSSPLLDKQGGEAAEGDPEGDAETQPKSEDSTTPLTLT